MDSPMESTSKPPHFPSAITELLANLHREFQFPGSSNPSNMTRDQIIFLQPKFLDIVLLNQWEQLDKVKKLIAQQQVQGEHLKQLIALCQLIASNQQNKVVGQQAINQHQQLQLLAQQGISRQQSVNQQLEVVKQLEILRQQQVKNQLELMQRINNQQQRGVVEGISDKFQICKLCKQSVHRSKLPCHVRMKHLSVPLFFCTKCKKSSNYSKNNIKTHMLRTHKINDEEPVDTSKSFAIKVELLMKQCFPNVRSRRSVNRTEQNVEMRNIQNLPNNDLVQEENAENHQRTSSAEMEDENKEN